MLTGDMREFRELHKDLDSQSKDKPSKDGKGVKDINKEVWNDWWLKKLYNNQQLIKFTKQGKYDEVVKIIDINFMGDMAASFNYQEPGTGYTCMHYSCKNRDKQMTNLFLGNYADFSLQDSNGQTPLHIVCQRGDLSLYKLITSNGWAQSMMSLDKNGKTPLSLAQENKHNIILDYDRKNTILLFADKKDQKQQDSYYSSMAG